MLLCNKLRVPHHRRQGQSLWVSERRLRCVLCELQSDARQALGRQSALPTRVGNPGPDARASLSCFARRGQEFFADGRAHGRVEGAAASASRPRHATCPRLLVPGAAKAPAAASAASVRARAHAACRRRAPARPNCALTPPPAATVSARSRGGGLSEGRRDRTDGGRVLAPKAWEGRGCVSSKFRRGVW